jgi:cytochrome P450
MSAQYGPVVRYRFAHAATYQLNHPDAIQHVLLDNHKNYVRGALFDPIRQITGNSLFTTDGPEWLQKRRTVQQAFHRKQVAGFCKLMTEETERVLGSWVPGGTVDLTEETTRLTLAVVSRALFSHSTQEEEAALSQIFSLVLEDLAYRFDVPLYPPHWFPTPRNVRVRAALRKLDRRIYRLIFERRSNSRHQETDLLALLLNAKDPETGEQMSDQGLRNEMVTLFVAGHETTSQVLAWALYLLSQHEDIEARVREELVTVLGGRTPEAGDLPRLQFLRQVVDETMRLYPPVWITNRSVVSDDEILGYRIPRGAIVLLSPYVMHRHPGYWEDPDKFDPDRFAPERQADVSKFVYFPFLQGPHQCIGNTFAISEALLVLATLLQHFRLELEGSEAVEPLAETALRPRAGIRMRVRRFEGSATGATASAGPVSGASPS